jgi:hypothetical protein
MSDDDGIILQQQVTGRRLIASAADGLLEIRYQEGTGKKHNIWVPAMAMGDSPKMEWMADPESGASIEVEILPNIVRIAWPEMSVEDRAEMRKTIEECEAESARERVDAEVDK